jgi:type IV secretion system protein VirB9
MSASAMAEDASQTNVHSQEQRAPLPAATVFDYAAGTRYTITSAVLHLTDLALEPGEEFLGEVAAGDTVRWMVANAKDERGRQHLIVKPAKPGISTNMIVRTTRRTYLLELRSGEATEPFMMTVGWRYPSVSGPRAQAVPVHREATATVAANVTPDAASTLASSK